MTLSWLYLKICIHIEYLPILVHRSSRVHMEIYAQAPYYDG